MCSSKNCVSHVACNLQKRLKCVKETWPLAFVFPGVLGESVLAAQHVIIQIGFLIFTV